MRVKFKDLECFRDYVTEQDYESEEFTVWKPATFSEIKKEEPKQIKSVVVDEDTEIYAEEFGLRTSKNFNDDFEQIDFSILDFDDGLLPTIETKSPAPSDELDKSHNATFGSFNQIHDLSTEEAGLDKRQSSNKVLNESTEEVLLDMKSIFDSKPEIMSNNDTDSIISPFPVVERKVRSVPTKPVNEMESVTLDIEINSNIAENVSSSLETDSVSVNTTRVENVSSSLETDSVSVNTTRVENTSSSLETDSVSVNTTHVENTSSSLETDSVSVNTTRVENVSSSLETDSVSVNTTHVENTSSSLETDSVSVNTTRVENTSSSLETDSVSVNTTRVENTSSSLETDSVSVNTTRVENTSSSLETDSVSVNTTRVENVSSSLETDSVSVNTTRVENTSSSLETDSVSVNTTHVENTSSSLETDSVSVNTTHVENVSSSLESDSVSVNTTHVENASSSLETDSVSAYSTHSPIIKSNFTYKMNETHIFPTNTSITLSDYPAGDRNITMEDDSPSLNSSESNLLLSNQTLVNKTVIQEEANTKNNTDLADGDHDSSGHVFKYHVSSPDSLSNSSDTQTEEDFVLLDGGHPLEVSTDYTTAVEYKVSLMDTPEEIGELTENTTRIQELNSTEGNYTSEMFSQMTSETESIFNLSLSSPLRNNTLKINESESTNPTLSDFSLDLESEITENSKSPINVTMKSHSEILRNASELFSSDSTENVSLSLGPFNVSSMKNGSESESEEEVVIYLRNNHSEAIITSHLNPKEEHWGYEGKHELVPMEIPDHMNKYILDKSAANSNKPKTEKKKKVVHERIKPRKGYGMKTKKRKEYKPQPRSNVSPKGLSPRGFGPSGLTPRGSRPISSEDDLMGKSIVIGVPRHNFNDYELYVPKHEQIEDFDSIIDPPEEYEYVEYKDPYSKTADMQSPVLDATSQHFLKIAGDKDTRTFFISVEEEEWDYAGYGQRYCWHHVFQIIKIELF